MISSLFLPSRVLTCTRLCVYRAIAEKGLNGKEPELFGIAKGMYDSTPEDKAVRAVFVAPGVFEQCHHMSRIEEVLIAMYECPDELKSMIDMLVDFELKIAKDICDHWIPEAIFHHDDWGSQKSTFMSAEMFEEFFVPAYKKIYGYYKERGVKWIIHHSDSYAATFVPAMIEMGIDCWQGCFSTNDLPKLIEKYGDKISFMGGIENHLVDKADWTVENCDEVARWIIKECGKKSFCPCIAQGGPGSVFPGVYEALWNAIDQINCEEFGCTLEELNATRVPMSVMF